MARAGLKTIWLGTMLAACALSGAAAGAHAAPFGEVYAERYDTWHYERRHTTYDDGFLYADPYTYYCPVSANNGLGHMVMTFNGYGVVSDVRDMPFGGRPCTPQPPMRVLPGLN